MINRIFFALGVSLAFCSTGLAQNQQQNTNEIVFTENKGQVHDQYNKARHDVLYGVIAGEMAVHIKKTGVSYQLNKVDSYKDADYLNRGAKVKEIDKQSIYRVDLTWLNCNTSFKHNGESVLPGYTNYYLQSCPNGATNVRSYQGVTLHNLYDGIDLHYYSKDGNLKHDYIVKPHADYKKIQIYIQGAEVQIQKDGSLLIETPFGKVQEGAPKVFQNRMELKAKWVCTENFISFSIEEYDENFELIIDPATRLWGTYYGGSDKEYAFSTATDSIGNVYLAGRSDGYSTFAIATIGSHQSTTYGPGAAFLAKFNPNGTRLWATYYGNNGGSTGYACATDLNNNVYLAGATALAVGNAISTVGAHQSGYGGVLDAFLAKFDSNGVRLWGTYYGGANLEWARSCKTDSFGNVYITGQTASSSAIDTIMASPNAYQPLFGGGYFDAYLAKFNSNGVRQWSTFIGGTGDEEARSCAIAADGNIIITGFTSSTSGTAITTQGSQQSTYGGGASDAFVMKFTSNGVRVWGTYYGGAGEDRGTCCTVDPVGNVYFVGETDATSTSAISTLGSFQFLPGGQEETFLVKFDSTGNRIWGTYFGGLGKDYVKACAITKNNKLIIAGETTSFNSTQIATAFGHQPVFGGDIDAYLAQFDSSGFREIGTYYGGSADENGNSCSIDLNGNIYFAGITRSNVGNIIATQGAHQSQIAGFSQDYDCFLVKFAGCNLPKDLSPITGSLAVCSGTDTYSYSVLTASYTSIYNWTFPNGWQGISTNPTISVIPGNTGVVSVEASNNCGSSVSQTIFVTVHPQPNVSIASNNSEICIGSKAVLTGSGALFYNFVPGGTAVQQTISPTTTTTYTLIGIDGNGCKNSAVFTQNVNECLKLSENQTAAILLTVFPNPARTFLQVEVTDIDLENIGIELLSVDGKVLYQSEFLKQVSSNVQLVNIEDFESGLYILRIKNKQNVLQSKTVMIE